MVAQYLQDEGLITTRAVLQDEAGLTLTQHELDRAEFGFVRSFAFLFFKFYFIVI